MNIIFAECDLPLLEPPTLESIYNWVLGSGTNFIVLPNFDILIPGLCL